MKNRNGLPIFYELMTTDPDAAQDYYGKVMGWRFQKFPGAPGDDYRIFTAGDGDTVGAVMKAPDGAGFAPIWAIYFFVADVDAAARAVKSLGGRVHMEPQDIPGVGRFAFVADPQGAVFYLMRGDGDTDSTAFAPARPGHGTWNELVTTNQKAALEFYSALFGWRATGTMKMGDAGDYTFFGKGESAMIGGFLDGHDGQSQAHWNVAFYAADLDAAEKTSDASGGRTTMDPTKLPGCEDWHLRLSDPQGAQLILVGAYAENNDVAQSGQ